LPQHCYDLFGSMSLLHRESFPALLRPAGFSHISWIRFREGRQR
jgi:hypothetical protein